MTQHEIMTVQEVADLLRVSERTVYDWATNGQIPCGKLGTAWRFKRSEIDNWVDKNLAPRRSATTSPIISIRDVLSPEHVIKLATDSKREALETLVDTVSTSSAVKNRDEVAEGIFNREGLMSTGIGFGVAIPHVRLNSIDKLVMAVGVSESDITDYESLDGKPVRILFMILAGSDQHAQHIKTLARISDFIKDSDLRQSLLTAEDANSIFELLIKKAS